ncbi:hypothetical protein SteCoe_21182 [Stentor coeruleus]|uniref:Uncharacterized protein n=1 Tax=Stentor coeruleus TaxID=5963 RepID=A0A1R2BQ41_9CILI|nr:hypothetical protein SteCoe_21182 [Stentor coeruleus]
MEINFKERKASASPKNHAPHGVEKYFAELERKKAENENITLQNRIRKLTREEENAKRKVLLSIQRAGEMTKLKDQYINTLQEKFNDKMRKKKEEDLLRIRLNEAKYQRKEKMKKINEEVLIQKQNQAKEIKFMQQMNEEMYKEYLKLVHNDNFKKALNNKLTKLKSSTERSKSVLDQQSNLREDYLKIIEEHKNEHLKAINQRSELIKIEAELLKRLSDTKNQMKTLDIFLTRNRHSLGSPEELQF